MDTPDTTPPYVGSEHPAVPGALQISAALGWRLLVVAATLAVIGFVVGYLAAVVVPVAIALLLAALLAPAVGYLVKRKVPRWLAAALVLVGGLAVLGGLLTFVIITFVNGLPALQIQLSRSIDAIGNWLTTGPLHLSDEQVRTFFDNLVTTLTSTQTGITAGALTTATTIGEILAQMLLILFVLIFLLYDGHGIWQFLLRAAPHRIRNRVDVAGRRSLSALVSYVRATIAVATVDAVGAGIGLVVLGVPLAIPLAALVFLGAFIPIIGGVVAGGIAVLIALVANGPVSALVLLGIVIGVQQLEAHVLQPLLLGRAVNLHPLAVVLAIAVGLVAAGIPGALLAVPLLAVLNSGIRSLRGSEDERTTPTDVHPSSLKT
ncbi:AI-2E family transporter [Kibdelosporangium persicum]|uniref:PurR-regulated permease PerM n=1 Tax=Kibdelosporangium persicum TaxID=2698649 RepID=A0ABX2FAV2_9PSEU|nr:AI-2E family transporter [Kibdelosporangium persicum]NRN68026.1 putative PurR-regulated permease PerM [Kibdelosporangium persicum]